MLLPHVVLPPVCYSTCSTLRCQTGGVVGSRTLKPLSGEATKKRGEDISKKIQECAHMDITYGSTRQEWFGIAEKCAAVDHHLNVYYTFSWYTHVIVYNDVNVISSQGYPRE
jgi:hypothetical protein